MTRRLGKAPRPCSPPGTEKSTPRTHQKRHLHLTNNIHVKNHIHMQRSHSRMLDQRRTPHHLPLRRELTAVRKVKALQDPSTSSSFSPVSACSSVTRHETSNAGAQLDELQAHEKARRQARRRIARETEQAGMDNVERSHGHGSRDARNRRRDADEYAALAQWSDRLRDHQLFSKSQHQREPPPWSAGYRGEERWQGDAEEIARRLIAEQSGQIPSPAHSYMSNLARAHGLSLLGFRDDITTSEAEGSFLESEDGLAGISSSHLSNSAGSPLVRSHRTRRRPLPNGNSNRAGALHSRRRAIHGYKEAPVVPTISDELDVSEIPQNGCGMPWYWTSGANKYKGKSLLDYANLGLTCAFPETALKKKTGDSKQVSRASSRHGSQRDLQVPIDAESHAVPLLNEAHEDEVDDAPARETPVSARVKSPRPSQARDALETSTSKIPSPFTRSVSQKYKPKSFRDMVGQPLVVKSLTTAITKGKVAPVYLFTGPRGTGKTTCARVFAAALVCLNTEPHRRPCGLCRECATITLNRSRDVKEVDIGRFASLDNIKSSLSLSASNARQQVVIVEGCDALSVEVWTSFLKFLDDPPRGIVFILITSDGLERLPLSATSRCQKYHFGKLKESEIAARLQVLAEKENLDVDEAALRLISSRADGSLRDAESMLDQLSLLDQTITLSMVQELSGLIPDEKLVELLDMALAADTVNTVKGMRALLDAGIDALSLVAQLASLITNILAGTFDLRREARKKGFFSRSMPRAEEQQRLRQALKVLAECEKQLRASNDRPTWLTAALLQFAPDRSYLPSSVDTSMAPSPIAFDTFERVPSGEPCTPRLPPPQPAGTESRSARKQSQSSPKDISSGFPRPGQGHRDKEKSPVVASPAAKVHPSGTESASDQAEGRSRRPTGSLVLFDPARAVGNRDFRVLPRRDMEDIWGKVLDGCRSNVLRQLLSSQGTLMALAVARDETFAVAHVEFRSPEHKARAERLRSSTCHAFQMALGCPVELKLSLECPPSVVLEEIKASNVVTLSVPSTSETANARAFGHAEDVDPSTESPPDEALPRHRRRKPKSRQEMLTGLAARSRRLGDAGSRASLDSRDGNIIGNKYCFPMECVSRDAAGSSRRHRLGRRPSLNRVPSGRRETLDGSGAKRVSVRWKYPKFKGIANLERRRTRRLEPRRKRTRAALCWQSPISETGQQEQMQTRRHPEPEQRKGTFFLRLVPCGRSTQTHGSPSRP